MDKYLMVVHLRMYKCCVVIYFYQKLLILGPIFFIDYGFGYNFGYENQTQF